ncbi:MAG: hypothetical protein FMNOHCHN_03655 [Ignavibacteriaceae bacterium]|nr:hypothetical protein [Ignavibacteriaceae bacterium]
MSEEHSWTKWFSGMVDPTAYMKTLAIILRAGFILLILSAIIFSILWVKNRFTNKRVGAPVTIQSNAGTVHASTDDNRKKFCFILC